MFTVFLVYVDDIILIGIAYQKLKGLKTY